MRSRGYAVFLALVLAVVATAGVYLYVKSVKDNEGPGTVVDIVVANVEIPPGSALDSLIDQNAFSLREFPSDSIVQGALTRIEDLRGRTTATTILAGEQVSTARLQGTENKGGVLGIQDGFEAVTISLDAPHAGGGFVQPGDHVTVYAQYGEFEVTPVPKNLTSFIKSTTEAPSKQLGALVLTVVPETRVLRVLAGAATTSTTAATGTTSEIQMSLELTPRDAERVILAQETGSLWISLLPPNQAGENQVPFLGGELLQPSRGARQTAL